MTFKLPKYIILLLIGFFLLSYFSGYYIGPLVKVPLVDKNLPSKIFVTVYRNNVPIGQKTLLSEDPNIINNIISNLKWTFVTNMVSTPPDKTQYLLTFENDLLGQIYPLYYFPESKRLGVFGYQNDGAMMTGLHSSPVLLKLIEQFESS